MLEKIHIRVLLELVDKVVLDPCLLYFGFMMTRVVKMRELRLTTVMKSSFRLLGR